MKFVRDIVREVTGFCPYERRTLELLRVGRDKKALKFLKKRVCECATAQKTPSILYVLGDSDGMTRVGWSVL